MLLEEKKEPEALWTLGEEKKENEEIGIQKMEIKDYPLVAYELLENSMSAISSDNYEKASLMLLKLQDILEIEGWAPKEDRERFKLLAAHNIALCFQKMGLLPECGNQLRGCLKIHAQVVQREQEKNLLRHLRYAARAHLQYCALLSQQSQHLEALDHAKYGLQFSLQLISETIKLLESQVRKVTYRSPETVSTSTYFNPESQVPSLFGVLAKRMLPVLYVFKNISAQGGKIDLAASPKITDLFGLFQTNEYVRTLNIGSIMQITPLCLQEINSAPDREHEATREALLEKISLVTISYFCLATEKRFLSKNAVQSIKHPKSHSEYWHGHALALACAFLPADCPLASHIYTSYQKHHSIVQQTIREDEEASGGVRILRSFPGATELSFQPVIRDFPDSSFSVSPIRNTEFQFPQTPFRSATDHRAKANRAQILAMIYSNPRSVSKQRPNRSYIESNKRQMHINIGKFTPHHHAVSQEEDPFPQRPRSSHGSIHKVGRPTPPRSQAITRPNRQNHEKLRFFNHVQNDSTKETQSFQLLSSQDNNDESKPLFPERKVIQIQRGKRINRSLRIKSTGISQHSLSKPLKCP